MKNWEKELLGIWEAETQSHRTTARAKKMNWWKAGSKETEKYGGKKKKIVEEPLWDIYLLFPFLKLPSAKASGYTWNSK